MHWEGQHRGGGEAEGGVLGLHHFSLCLLLQVRTAALHVLVVVLGQQTGSSTTVDGATSLAEQCHYGECFGTVLQTFIVMALLCLPDSACECFRVGRKGRNHQCSKVATTSQEKSEDVITISLWVLPCVFSYQYNAVTMFWCQNIPNKLLASHCQGVRWSSNVTT